MGCKMNHCETMPNEKQKEVEHVEHPKKENPKRLVVGKKGAAARKAKRME